VTRLLLVGLVGLVAVALAGCNATKRELTVVFVAGTTTDQHIAALRACTGVAPHTTPEPQPTSTRFASSDVRFRIDAASDRDISQLEACLAKQPGVQGFQDSNDST
jgi:hypothetical protein